ncbi:MAG: alanine--tRNA ligase [Dokdonia sp.]|jgi:alanyl-tRNA synthetase
MKSQEIRTKFLEFFKSKNHTIVPSAPMVLKDDPTLMFTNAGMVPFKEYFLGNAVPKSQRITDTQKCLRVSGKHNDLEEVGKDTYHHTMFEMLGNWSFGDYFKEEAIAWAWELLTDVYKIDKDSLYVSIFEGDPSEGLVRDQQAYDIWKRFISEDRIIDGNKKDNFWEMGAQGPCGPCSEIHVDIRSAEEKAAVDGKSLVNQDHPLVIEVWNLVFMQYNRLADGSLENLPATHVDTGMGFERLCMVLQGVQSNYETDVFTPLMREIETITSSKCGVQEDIDVAVRVIADHLRAVSFSIADGQLPSNTGAGYVIRRILRRAIRYGFTFLDTKEPFIYKLVATLVKQMGASFPELKAQKNLITNVIKEEEHSFLRTLDQGLILLDSVIDTERATQKGSPITISGEKVFELYDTYGFPEDLTALILSEKGLAYDKEGFIKALQAQKDRSRAASKVETGDWTVLYQDTEEEFIGYDTLEANVKITRYRKVQSKKDGELYQLVFNLTPFYPEGGGQVGDKGYLEAVNGEVVYIIDTKKENNLIIHLTKNLPRSSSETFKAVVDAKQRSRTNANHSATHLLHQALRKVLGTHVEQKGSMVHSRSLRFDFSHFSKVTPEQLKAVEDFVNARIRENLPLQEQRAIAYDQAIAQGAIALFGEKYGDAVRTIAFGKSMELCGGTHVAQTGDIWHFKIMSEGAVAAGIRRIEAITSDAAKDYFTAQTEAYDKVKQSLKNPQDPIKAITAMMDENTALKKQVESLIKEKAQHLSSDLASRFETINGISFLAQKVDLDAAAIKDLAFSLGANKTDAFILFGTEQNGKALLSCYISKELVAARDLNAGQVVRELGKHIQGGGGGQAFFATAGGKNPAGINDALEAAKAYIQ